jgi:hypothetical protein
MQFATHGRREEDSVLSAAANVHLNIGAGTILLPSDVSTQCCHVVARRYHWVRCSAGLTRGERSRQELTGLQRDNVQEPDVAVSV